MSVDQPLVLHPEVAFALADGLGRVGAQAARFDHRLAEVGDVEVGAAVLRLLRAADQVAAVVTEQWWCAADALTMAIAATVAADASFSAGGGAW